MVEQPTTLNISANELVERLLSLESSVKLSLLDSCGRTLGGSKFLIAGIYPTENFEFDCQTQSEAFAALRFLDEKLKFYQDRQNPSQLFGGGICVATLAYEFGLLLEEIPPRERNLNASKGPAATFSFYETIFVHDYETEKSVIVGRNAVEFAQIIKEAKPTIAGRESKLTALPPPFASSNFTKDEYLTAVEQIRKHIQIGDIYQANFTQQLCVELPETIASEQIFWDLRQSHPAPFAAFIRRDKDSVVSASPERFFKVQNLKSKIQSAKSSLQSRIITASPIKGTRGRGKTVAEDLRLRQELEQSSKDKAENVMIVDLLRNDLGRVCKFGSVAADKLFEIEEHPTLFHLVSTITGELEENVTFGDLLRATFPCGSITGAPKIRAMQILDGIETARRGLSMGAIGYFAFDHSADLSVAIRTMTVRDETAIFNVGGGIVFDSQAESEYEESWLKAKALLSATRALR